MKMSSLPHYPEDLRRGLASEESAPKLSRGRGRLLMDLGWLVVIVVVLWWMKRTTDAIEASRAPVAPRDPLPFRLVAQRFDSVPLFATRTEVERLLGPPTEHRVWGPGLARAEERAENGGRNEMPQPADRIWDRWSDPADQRRWVAVLYGGYSESAKVYSRTQGGF
jgi:hypothetical protein